MRATELVRPKSSLAAKVHSALIESGYNQLRTVRVTSIPDGVCLTGRVPTYYLKQIAQSLALETDGVIHVDSRMEVHQRP